MSCRVESGTFSIPDALSLHHGVRSNRTGSEKLKAQLQHTVWLLQGKAPPPGAHLISGHGARGIPQNTLGGSAELHVQQRQRGPRGAFWNPVARQYIFFP